MKVECPSLSELQKMAGNKNVEYLTVYSKSLQLEKLGKQTDLPDGSIGLVHDDIILIKLAPGQVRLYNILLNISFIMPIMLYLRHICMVCTLDSICFNISINLHCCLWT